MNKAKVYIVEDDPMVAYINKKYIEKLPDFCVVGSSSEETDALERIKELRPDLVLLDIYLPEGNGVDLLKQIRYFELPSDVICVTAASDSATINKIFRLGAIDYILKPFDDIRLERALKSYLKIRNLISKTAKLSQDDLDQLNLFAEKEKTLPSLPKGLHLITLEQILTFLLKHDNYLTCQQIASALSMSRITVWRYLEYLLHEEKITVDLEYGTVGRPTKQYRIKSV
ncbi:MAG: response regulator [Peptococcaceae bacterium]|nr:response regulator [Peptococcaceae bacterium]